MSISQSNTADNAVEQVNGSTETFDPETATWADFERYDGSVTYTYRHECGLRYLYHTLGWTQTRIADRYNVSQPTISRWLAIHGIEARKTGSVSVYSQERGDTEYMFIDARYGDERVVCYVHQLLACRDNDPHDVFDGETVVHHRFPSPAAIDIQENVVVLTQSEHVQLHMEGDTLDDVAEVLDGCV